MTAWVLDIVAALGLLLAVVGIWIISPAVALITLGVVILAVSILLAKQLAKRSLDEKRPGGRPGQ